MAARRHPARRACAAGQQARRGELLPRRLPGAHLDPGGAAWESVGHAIAAYEIALDHAITHVQFGKPIASFQLVQHKLACMLAEITAMQLYCFRMAELQEQGRWTGPMASLAKMNHAQKARQVCLDARDILGGNGLLLENHVAGT